MRSWHWSWERPQQTEEEASGARLPHRCHMPGVAAEKTSTVAPQARWSLLEVGTVPALPSSAAPSPGSSRVGLPSDPRHSLSPGLAVASPAASPGGSGTCWCVKAGSESLVKPIAPLSTFCPGDPERPGKASTLRREPGQQDCVCAGEGEAGRTWDPHPAPTPRPLPGWTLLRTQRRERGKRTCRQL